MGVRRLDRGVISVLATGAIFLWQALNRQRPYSKLLKFLDWFSVTERHLSGKHRPISAMFEARCESVSKIQMKAPA